MLRITEKKEEGKIILEMEGRIDTNTGKELQAKILNCFQKSLHLILDMEQVDYVSSAGLRTLLIGEKTAKAKNGSMLIVHVQPGVREVFAMSGFNRVLQIAEDDIL